MAALTLPLLVLSLLSLVSVSLGQTATYQWGYLMRCQPFTIDYPCLIQVSGTAVVNSTLLSSGTLTLTNANGTSTRFTAVPYYKFISFTGTRTHTNKYGQTYPVAITLPPANDTRAAATNLYLDRPYVSGQGFRMDRLTEFIGGLIANEFYVSLNPYASETININGGAGNALNVDPTATIVCSTAPGFVVRPYNFTSQASAGSATMTDCTNPQFTPVGTGPAAADVAPGLRAFAFSYTTGDFATYYAALNSVIYTDGTVQFDQLGNVYYPILQILGNRTYTALPSGNTSTHNINGLMSQGVVPSGTGPGGGITYNMNKLYLNFPYLDRFGIAMTLDSNIAPDGQITPSTDILGVLVYRESTLEEHTPNGGTYPPTNIFDIPEPITLTPLPIPSGYQLVTWCYVMYGLPGTLDYPWSEHPLSPPSMCASLVSFLPLMQ